MENLPPSQQQLWRELKPSVRLGLVTTREREVLIGAARQVRDLPGVSWISGLCIPESEDLFKKSRGR